MNRDHVASMALMAIGGVVLILAAEEIESRWAGWSDIHTDLISGFPVSGEAAKEV